MSGELPPRANPFAEAMARDWPAVGDLVRVYRAAKRNRDHAARLYQVGRVDLVDAVGPRVTFDTPGPTCRFTWPEIRRGLLHPARHS